MYTYLEKIKTLRNMAEKSHKIKLGQFTLKSYKPTIQFSRIVLELK